VILFGLAARLWAQPDPAMLRRLYEQHLIDQQAKYGQFDSRTAAAARDLGLFLRNFGDPAGAYQALTQTVAIDEKVFGPDAPRTLADVADLATVAPAADSGKLFERAAKSSDDAAASRALVALGELHASQGDREGAAKLWRQALSRQEAATGRDSGSVAIILNVLAQSVEPAEAIPLLRRALTLDRRLMGVDHPEVGATDQLLAGALLASGKAAEAEAPAREAVSILSLKLGDAHPRTAAAAATVADVLRAAGKYAEAEQMYRRAIKIDDAVLGPQHPATLEEVRVLAAFLRERGKGDEAAALERSLVTNVAR
jgi:tetratricopeptide (TPR) repeat protein